MPSALRILHVEDDPEWLNIIRSKFLNDSSVHLDQATTLGEAQQKITNYYDLIIADLDLHNSDRESTSGNSHSEESQSLMGHNRDLLDDFEDFMHELGVEQGRFPFDDRPAIVVLTGHELGSDDLVRLINRYPSWIWGWLNKALMEDDDLFRAVNALKRYRQRSRRLIYKAAWPGGIMQLIAYLVVIVVIWGFYQFTGNTLLAITASILPLPLLILLQAFFLMQQHDIGEHTYGEIIITLLRTIVKLKDE